jgi:molybdopterin-containing oxidoreductase family iron-sulfur binding subunit
MSPETLNPIVANAAAPSAADLLDRIHGQSGPAYWRSLNELAGAQEIDAFVHREFPSQAHALLDPVSRRNFLRVMGASMMLAGLSSSCARQPEEKILPYVKPPEYSLPGRATFYATCVPVAGGCGVGVLATCHEGRPTHLSGLKEHTASLGGISSQAQASVLSLYDPDRLDAVIENGNISTYTRFSIELARVMESLDAHEGDGLRVLTETVTSPTMAWQIDKLRALYPAAQWHQYEPLNRGNAHAGAELALGRPLDTRYNFNEAHIIVSLDSNFLADGPGHVRYASQYAASRDVDAHPEWMSRLYAAESATFITGSNADHRVALRFPDIETLTRVIARGVGIADVDLDASAEAALPAEFVKAVIQDLNEHKGHAVVVPGDEQPAAVHALAHAINAAIGATTAAEGKVALVEYTDPIEAEPVNQLESLKTLTDDMNAGKVACLVIIGGNPVYTAPADIDFLSGIRKVAKRIALVESVNETSWECHWQIPLAHTLESWSDIRGFDGLTSLIQPMIAPLHNGRSAHEVLAIMTGEDKATAHDVVQAFWTARRGPDGFDLFWQESLQRGFTARELLPLDTAKLKLKNDFGKHTPVAREGLDVVFRPDPMTADGRYANSAWLQETPKPLTNLTWDNAVHMNPRTAKELGLDHEDLVTLELGGRTITGGVMYQFGQTPGTAVVHLGYGRTRCGHIGKGRGFSAYALQSSTSPWFGTGAKVAKAGGTYMLARTEEHWNIEQSHIEQAGKAEDRHLVREGSFTTWKAHPDFAQHMGHHAPDPAFSLYYPDEKAYTSLDPETPGYTWGMTIDLNKCTGCASCVTACQSENNIPIVGKDQVQRGREMQWIRVDRYYKSDSTEGFYGVPDVVHQPLPCMQCENAPCEPVCPVGATMHSDEGLNDMVYNRCIGTRYCANNCPYKVRRFNFFHYQVREGQDAPTLKMMRNPNVTVRTRGVMEKCTYCVQRINHARIESKRRDIERERIGQPARGIEDGTVMTACQQACPAGAITFGDMRDQTSAVHKTKSNPRNYGLLADIGTRPRTTYLAKLRNPSPLLGGAEADSHATTEH